MGNYSVIIGKGGAFGTALYKTEKDSAFLFEKIKKSLIPPGRDLQNLVI